MIDGAYGHQFDPVAFKPPWAKGDTTFGQTRVGTVSYFIGADAAFDDPGFPIGTSGDQRSSWMICRPEIAVIPTFGNLALGSKCTIDVRVLFHIFNG